MPSALNRRSFSTSQAVIGKRRQSPTAQETDMSSRSIQLSENVYSYLIDHSLREPPLLRALRDETSSLSMAMMQISPEQGQLMRLLAELMGASKALEVGTFTGYSSLCVALALPDGGELVACDVSEEWTALGRKYWKLAGVERKIDLRIDPAVKTLESLLPHRAGDFDFAFIDADKKNYGVYYELCLALLRPGGLLLVDNVLWGGSVADPSVQDEDTEAIRRLNEKICRDDRVLHSMLPVGDGLSLVRKKS
jgi:predicted O-methyltransferase YrrM